MNLALAAGVVPNADLIKAAAALQVMGAGPWQTLGRGKYMYETIVQHLPDPKDTPTLLYDKAGDEHYGVVSARAA